MLVALANIFLIMSDVLISSLSFLRFHHSRIAGIGSSVTHFQLLHSAYVLRRVHYMHLALNIESPRSLFCHLVIIP